MKSAIRQVLLARRSTALVLDTVALAAAAYSVRKLSTSYSGSCLRVRRSSDNAESDIGFVSNELDTASLLSFVGANNGFVVTWYDQSGNTRNLTQSTQSAQPQIVTSGAISVSQNGKAGLSFGSSRTMVAASWGAIPQPYTRNILFTNKSPSGHVLNNILLSPNVALFLFGANLVAQFASESIGSFNIPLNSSATITVIFNGASSSFFGNGSLNATGTLTGDLSGLAVASDGNNGNFSSINSYEVFVFHRALSTVDRQLLERSQGNYYGITVA